VKNTESQDPLRNVIQGSTVGRRAVLKQSVEIVAGASALSVIPNGQVDVNIAGRKILLTLPPDTFSTLVVKGKDSPA
jgi:hypothetical protein